MRRLNKNLPFSRIYGETADGAIYKQGKVRFDAQGDPVPGQAGVDYGPDKEPEVEIIDGSGGEVEIVDDSETLNESDFDSIAASEIRRMVNDAGGEYLNRAQGIEFLRNQSADTPDETV
jgi:hypothetical protein